VFFANFTQNFAKNDKNIAYFMRVHKKISKICQSNAKILDFHGGIWYTLIIKKKGRRPK
jgi:hypothetical protein